MYFTLKYISAYISRQPYIFSAGQIYNRDTTTTLFLDIRRCNNDNLLAFTAILLLLTFSCLVISHIIHTERADPHQVCFSLDTRGPAALTPHEPSHVRTIPATTALVAVTHHTRPHALTSASSCVEPTPAPHFPCPRPRQPLPTWATWATAASLWPLWAPCPPHLSAERYPPHTLSPPHLRA